MKKVQNIAFAFVMGALLLTLPACEDKYYDTTLGDQLQEERETLAQGTAFLYGDLVGEGYSYAIECILLSENVTLDFDEETGDAVYDGTGYAFDLFCFSEELGTLAEGTYELASTTAPFTLYPAYTAVSVLHVGVATALALESLQATVKRSGDNFDITIEATTTAGAPVHARFCAPLAFE